MLHEAYPNYRALADPKRHLIFNFGDSTQLWAALLFHGAAFIAVLLIFQQALLGLAIVISCVLRVMEIRRHVADPWYYPLRAEPHYTAFAPERPATTTIREQARFFPDDAIRTAHLSPLERFFRYFRRESIDAPEATRNAIVAPLSRLDSEVFGLPRPPAIGWRYPTGRGILHAMRTLPIFRALGTDVPLRRARLHTGTPHALPDFLPWRSKPDHRSIRTTDEVFVRSWRVSGGTADSINELAQIKARLDNALIQLFDGATVHALIAIQKDRRSVPERPYPVEAAALTALEHRRLQEHTSRISVTVDLHLVYDARRDPERPRQGADGKAVSLATYQRFVGLATSFETMLERGFATVEPLARTDDDDPQAAAVALPLTIGGTPLRLPNLRPDAHLAEVLGRHHVSLDRDNAGVPNGHVRIDDRLVDVYDLYDLQAQSVAPDILRLLEGHEAPILLSLRWIACTRNEQKKETREGYSQALRSTEQAPSLSGDGRMPNLAAVEDVGESLNLDRLIDKHQARLGYASVTVALYEHIGQDGLDAARERLSLRSQRLTGAMGHEGFNLAAAAPQTSEDPADTTVVVQAIPALFGMLPGNLRDNLLRNPMPSGLLANLITSYSPWAGNEHIVDPDQLFRTTDGDRAGALFVTTGMDRRRFAWAPQSDRRGGHTILLADTGSGKSTLIARMISEYLSYDVTLELGARVILIDRDGSHKIHAALHHAQFLTCGDGATIGLNPFADVESEEGRAILQKTLEAMVRARGADLTKPLRKDLDAILACVRRLAPQERIADHAIFEAEIAQETKDLFARYTSREGCHLFSGLADPFASRYTYVDVAPAFASPELRAPTTLALLHAIELSAKSGRGPVLLVGEEFWELLRDPVHADIFLGWLKRLRKYGVWIWLVTHGLEDLDVIETRSEAMKNTIRNFVVLPSSKYYDQNLLLRLQSIGISAARAQQLAHYASAGGGTSEAVAEFVHDRYHRMVPIDVGPIGRAICGSTSEIARKRFAELLLRFDGAIGPTLVAWVAENGGSYAESWMNKARELVEEYDALREQMNQPSPRYDPRLFDPDVTDISPALVAS
ncbi:DUF87 domain-containing protein [bacterium]|nr:MAG: DUF87 domain-containing protein [bacterium]